MTGVQTCALPISTVTLDQGQSIIVVCDGTNVYNSQTATSSSFTNITLANGSAANPSLNFVGDLFTGLYLVASNQFGIAVNGANAATFSTTGLQVPSGISGGTFV